MSPCPEPPKTGRNVVDRGRWCSARGAWLRRVLSELRVRKMNRSASWTAEYGEDRRQVCRRGIGPMSAREANRTRREDANDAIDPRRTSGPRGRRTVSAPPNWGMDVVPLFGRLKV